MQRSTDLGSDTHDTNLTPAAPSSRRVVGVVRVLRGRLAAPCRCCSDAEDVCFLQEDEDRS